MGSERANRDTGRRGGWVRRRLLPRLAKLAALAGLLAIGVWITGRVMTDRTHWSQYIWWIPSAWVLLAGWGALVASSALGRLALRPGGVMLRPFLLLACVAATGWVLIGQWRVHRFVLGAGTTQAGPGAVRVLHYNQSSVNMPYAVGPELLAEAPDIVAVVNARRNEKRKDLARDLSALAPAEESTRLGFGITAPVSPGHCYITAHLVFTSAHPIRRLGTVLLPKLNGADDEWRSADLRGWVLFAEIERPEGGTMVIWVVDLPSDPRIWRAEVANAASEAVASWTGPELVPDEQGQWIRSGSDPSFPDPDLIIGDFNMLPGSTSLATIAPGMHEAGTSIGRGVMRSWVPDVRNRWVRQPVKISDWRIDLAFVGDDARLHDYELVPMRASPHHAQVVEFTP